MVVHRCYMLEELHSTVDACIGTQHGESMLGLAAVICRIYTASCQPLDAGAPNAQR